jgi:hypothetical protein
VFGGVVDTGENGRCFGDVLLGVEKMETRLRRAHERLKEIATKLHVSVEVKYGGKCRIT